MIQKKRWKEHRAAATRAGPRAVISKAIAKYGHNGFLWEVILSCRTQSDANDAETICVAQCCSADGSHGYNATLGGVNAPKTEAWKRLQSRIMKGRRPAPHAIANAHTPEARARISATLMGHHVTDETRNKIRATKTGVPCSADNRAKLKASLLRHYETHASKNIGRIGHMLGKRHTDETKLKISIAGKGKHKSPATEFAPGAVPWNKRLTPAQELEIQSRHRAGESKRSLSRAYCIDRTSIDRVLAKTGDRE